MQEQTSPSDPTLGTVLSRLVEERRGVFTYDTFLRVSGLPPRAAQRALAEFLRLGVVSRLRRELAQDVFLLVPSRLGIEPARLDPPFLLAHLLTGGRDYYISHGSAMALHRLAAVRQPEIYVMRPIYTHNRVVGGAMFIFVKCQPRQFFGMEERVVEEGTRVLVSDLERTLIDGLRQPKYCGGLTQIITGFQLRRRDVDIDRLVDYALALRYDNLMRRVGYVLELCRVDARDAIARVHAALDPEAAYTPLDPSAPRRGVCCTRWRLHINLSLSSLEGAAGLSRSDHLQLLR